MIVTTSGLKPFNNKQEKQTEEQLNSAYEPLRMLTPGMGAYLNEVGPDHPSLTWKTMTDAS